MGTTTNMEAGTNTAKGIGQNGGVNGTECLYEAVKECEGA